MALKTVIICSKQYAVFLLLFQDNIAFLALSETQAQKTMKLNFFQLESSPYFGSQNRADVLQAVCPIQENVPVFFRRSTSLR
jgi:hypothetical protein